MAAHVPASESIDVANWEINKDAFAPPTTRRVIRGWDRTAVSSHAPRLLRRKVWKVAVLKPMKDKAGEDEVQEELQKDGVGARKKPRKINAKENIGNPAWESSASRPSQDISVYFQKKKDEGSPAVVTEDETFTIPQEHPDISKLQFVPRKRTNANHVITPRKSRRRAVQAQQEPFAVYGINYLNSPRQQGKPLPKNIPPSTGKAPPRLQGTRGTSQLPEDFDHRKENNMALPNELKFDGLVAETESLRTISDFLVVGDSPESIVANLDEALAGTSPVAIPKPDDLIWSADTEEDYCTDVGPAELSYALQHEAMDLDSAVVKGCEESQANCLVSSLWEGSELVESESPGLSSIRGPDLRVGEEVQEDSTDKITYSPAISTWDCGLEALEAFAKFDTALDVTNPVGLTLARNSLLENGHIPLQTNDGDPSEGHETPATVDASSGKAENTDFTQATTSQSGAYKPSEVTEFLGSEKQATNMGECETLNIKTDEEADVLPLANIPMTTYDDDHEDTDMLRNFLTRVKANKAAKKSPARRRRSLPHSPLRTPLGEADSNTSPSPEKPEDEADPADTSSSTRGRKPLALGDEAEAKNRRSGRRTRLPGRATPRAPSVIPVRRLDQDVQASAPLTRQEDKETAALTRVNTRKNKGEALPVSEVLAKQRAQKEDPAMRQRLLKEAFDVKTGRGRAVGGAGAKTVTWAEELVQFRPATEGAGLTEGATAGATAAPVDEDRRPGAVRVGVRRKMALGMAVNGTPAPRRTARGRA